ncbi:hypothetical protein LIHA111178_13025 [Litorimonas haliclonae]
MAHLQKYLIKTYTPKIAFPSLLPACGGKSPTGGWGVSFNSSQYFANIPPSTSAPLRPLPPASGEKRLNLENTLGGDL